MLKSWDDRFSEKEFIYGKNENPFVNKMSPLIPKKAKVGCFAEGEG